MQQRIDTSAWLRSFLWAVLAMAVILAVAVLGNLAVGRVIHWDIVTGLGLFGLAALTYLKRQSEPAGE